MAILTLPAVEARTRRERDASGPTERRSEPRHEISQAFATATILGDEAGQQPCRILDASRRGMRIGLKKPLPVGAQIHVRWDDEFFVGVSRYAVERGEYHVLGLQLVACRYAPVRGRRAFGWRGMLTSWADRALLLGRALVSHRRSPCRVTK